MRSVWMAVGAGLAFALSVWPAVADTGNPLPAVWKEQRLNFFYMGRTSRYSCDGLRDKMRALLLGGNDDAMPEGWGDDAGAGEADDVDMEITFTPGLSATKTGDETTLEKYQRRMREKRKKRKEEGPEKEAAGEKATSEGSKEKVDDEFFEANSGDEGKVSSKDGGRKGKSAKGRKKGDEEAEKPVRKEATEEELALLVASSNPDAEPKHFNLKSVIKAEKGKKRRKGRKDKKEDDGEAQEDFVVNVKDDRFKALFEDHQYAIDPTNPQFVFFF